MVTPKNADPHLVQAVALNHVLMLLRTATREGECMALTPL